MKKLIIISILALSGCTDPNKTKETLKDYGFSEIKTNGYNPFACGKDDFYSTNFTAKNPAGNVVSGTVCCGILKACTVRF